MNQYVLDKPDNLMEMFEESIARYGDREWLGFKDEEKTGYKWITYKEAAARVDACRAGLAQLGIKKGDAVGIIDNNSVAWAVSCYATYGLVARFIPMYKAELEKVWRYIIIDSAIKVLFVADNEIMNRIQSWKDEIDTLEHIILIEGEGPGTMAELEEKGSQNPVEALYPAADDIAGLIYTSGTTGDPKGVLLSHGNFTSNVHAILKIFPVINEETRTLSFLPWAHSYGQTAELNTIMRVGGSTGFAENATTIVEDLALVKPSMLVAVPRIFNRVYDGLNAKMNEDGGLAKFLFNMGVKSAEKRRLLAAEGKSSIGANLKFSIADKLVFSKIREKFGGSMEHAISSSAALSPHIAEFFFDIGIPVYEAWGMTEISPAGSVNSPDAFKIGSCGKALDKVNFVIDKSGTGETSRDGELIVYGPNVMKGYHNKPEATADTLTNDGGLRTGDRAFVDDDGYLYITGRIKEQFKLENGKFVYPAAMEEEIKLIPYVEHAMIYGLNKHHTVCLIFPDFVVMEKYAAENGISSQPEELIKDPKVIQLIENAIADQLKGKFGTYEIPRQILLLSEGFTVENGMLTQTLKLKRREVLKKYQETIDRLYLKN